MTTYHTLYTEYTHYAPWVPAALGRHSIRWITRHTCNLVRGVTVPTEPIREVLKRVWSATADRGDFHGSAFVRSYAPGSRFPPRSAGHPPHRADCHVCRPTGKGEEPRTAVSGLPARAGRGTRGYPADGGNWAVGAGIEAARQRPGDQCRCAVRWGPGPEAAGKMLCCRDGFRLPFPR